jgi:hypothetical protein
LQNPLIGRVGRFDIVAIHNSGYCVYDPDYPLAGPFETEAEAVRRAEAENRKADRKI